VAGDAAAKLALGDEGLAERFTDETLRAARAALDILTGLTEKNRARRGEAAYGHCARLGRPVAELTEGIACQRIRRLGGGLAR
jgi:hypothetical protein